MELTAGTKIRMLVTDNGYFRKGDIGRLCKSTLYHQVANSMVDNCGDYWADFHGNGNKFVADYDRICIGKLGIDFETVEEVL